MTETINSELRSNKDRVLIQCYLTDMCGLNRSEVVRMWVLSGTTPGDSFTGPSTGGAFLTIYFVPTH